MAPHIDLSLLCWLIQLLISVPYTPVDRSGIGWLKCPIYLARVIDSGMAPNPNPTIREFSEVFEKEGGFLSLYMLWWEHKSRTKSACSGWPRGSPSAEGEMGHHPRRAQLTWNITVKFREFLGTAGPSSTVTPNRVPCFGVNLLSCVSVIWKCPHSWVILGPLLTS